MTVAAQDDHDAAAAAPAEADAQAARRAQLRPLDALPPYVRLYRWRIAAAVALGVAAITTLVVPIAVRRRIDFGFTAERVACIDSYVAMMIAVVAVLALASASRFYLFFFQAEDGIRDLYVTGVQTCALPI